MSRAVRFEQGDVIDVEGSSVPLLVVSKNFFNTSEQAICCPIVSRAKSHPLHIPVRINDAEGIVLCEQMKYFDLQLRGYKKTGTIRIEAVMDITDTIQSIFDYY